MPHILPRTTMIATAAALLITATHAFGAWYIKFDGVDGETAQKGHKDWIVIDSVSLAPTAKRGVRVASGDVTGDGRADARSKPGGRDIDSGGADPVPTGLLLPAVQKMRVATASVPAWRGCRVGQRLPRLPIREDVTGRNGAILDARVTGCGRERVSFSFSKVEMP